jgi:hypothetical protein
MGGQVQSRVFVLEETFEGGDDRAYVVARVLDSAVSLSVSSGSTLGGCSVERWLDMPRAWDADGKQRADLFGFCLVDKADLARLKRGDQVVLT